MAKTLLNLKLNYKGKLLDIAKYGRDFRDKLYIGSNRFLFWQILDTRFPDKMLFISRRNDRFYLHLLPQMQLAFEQNGQTFNNDALKAKKILQNNEVVLNSDMTGKIEIAPDWSVTYEFIEPWVKVLTEEEKRIVAQYSRREDATPFERFSRNFTLLAAVATIIGMVLFNSLMKPKIEVADTLEQAWQQMQQQATKVEIPPPEASNLGKQFQEEMNTETTKETPSVKGTATKGSSTGTMSKEAAKEALSGLLGSSGFQAGSTSHGLVAVTTEESIVAAAMGGGKGSGPGKGPGGGPGSSGTGFGTAFDPTQVSSGSANLAKLSTGRPTGNLSTTAPGGNVTTYVGDVGRIVPVGKVGTKVSSGVITKFGGPGVRRVAEGNIGAAPAENRPELQRVESQIARYKPQIKKLFNTDSQIKSMYGTLDFVVYIEADGSVAGVQITPKSGEFYPEFLAHLEQLIRSWRFDNKSLVPYEFIMTFTK